MAESGNTDLGMGAGFDAGTTGRQQGRDAGSMGGMGAGMGGASSGGVQGTLDQAKQKAQDVAGQAKQQAGERIESGLHRGKASAATALGGLAQTLVSSSQQLRDQNQPTGQYVERAAQQVQRLSDFLQNTEVDEIVDRVEDVARRQPALFLGGMFALGLIGARFLKSSRRSQRSTAVTLYGDRGASGAYGAGYGSGAYAGGYGGTSGAGGLYGSGAGGYGDRDVTADQGIASEPRRDVGSGGLASGGISGGGIAGGGISGGGLDPRGSGL
jgi:hypothetical protein